VRRNYDEASLSAQIWIPSNSHALTVGASRAKLRAPLVTNGGPGLRNRRSPGPRCPKEAPDPIILSYGQVGESDQLSVIVSTDDREMT